MEIGEICLRTRTGAALPQLHVRGRGRGDALAEIKQWRKSSNGVQLCCEFIHSHLVFEPLLVHSGTEVIHRSL